MRVPPSNCTNCGEEHDHVTPVGKDDAEPKDGSVTICLVCGHLMVFEDNKLRNLTDAEMYEVAGDYRIIAAQKIRRLIQKLRKEQRK